MNAIGNSDGHTSRNIIGDMDCSQPRCHQLMRFHLDEAT